MAKRYSREEILQQLREQVSNNKAVFMFGAGIGLTAKCAELGGADLIGLYSTAFWRMMGTSSLMAWLPYSNANDELVKYSKAILPVVKHTPCIAGIGAHDPTRDINLFVDEIMDLGFSGVSNEPFVGIYGKGFADMLENAGIGFSREVELIRIAHRNNIFTLAWTFDAGQAERMAEAGADVIGAMIGLTAGGLSGAKDTITLESAVRDTQEICKAAQKINPDAIIITHGGPFEDVKTAQYSILHTDAVGYASGSSGERIPTEKAIIDITKEYKVMSTG